ncbi:MAG: choice-of-anchor V domain-containing protein [Flavobacteriales bacterium]
MKMVPATLRTSVLATLAASAFALTLMSHHNGVAEQQNKDRTGAPGSQQVCTACHSNGSYTVTPSITVYPFEGADTPVQTFMPNTEYYVEFTVGATGSPEGYGFQATAVFANGSNAGTFIGCTDNAQLEDVNGRHIVEQNDLSPSNTFGLYWGAPDGGEGPVTFYASMLAANGAYGNSGDSFGGTNLTLDEAVTSIECPDCLDPDQPTRIWATEYEVNVENPTDLTLDAFAVDGRWLRSVNLPAGRHTLSTADWGVRGLVIAQFSGVDAQGQTVLRTQRFWAH